MCEYNFVSKFVACCTKSNANITIAKQPKGRNQSTYADCEILYNNEIVKIEAKLLKDTRSNSANFFNLLGEVMATDKKQGLLQSQGKNLKIYSAILIPYHSKSVFDGLWKKNISKITGNNYCSNFNVKYLFAYDINQQKIYVHLYDSIKNNWS